MGIITRSIEAESNLNRFNKMKDGQYVLFENQIKCALEILKGFDRDTKKPNYTIVKGFTQSGKTGIFTSLINIINVLHLWDRLHINKIYYLTGDNSRALPQQTRERLKAETFVKVDESGRYVDLDFDDSTIGIPCDNTYIPILVIKQSDCKKQSEPLKNCLIFLDESHFGTSHDQNQVIQFLSRNNISMKNDSTLEENFVYIISNSATPYKETASDIAVPYTKNKVTLYPGDGYVGIKDFTNIVRTYDSITSDNANEFFLKEVKPHFDVIGHEKSFIIRVPKNVDLSRLLDPNIFQVKEFNSSTGNIKYDDLEMCIDYHNLRVMAGATDKINVIAIKGAYRMGISINWNAKRLIGGIYDITKSDKSIETTEQGLLGRICGYWKDDTYKNCKIFVNGDHWDALYKYYTESDDLACLCEKRPLIPCVRKKFMETTGPMINGEEIKGKIFDKQGETYDLTDYPGLKGRYDELRTSKTFFHDIKHILHELYPNEIILGQRRAQTTTEHSYKLRNADDKTTHGVETILKIDNIGKTYIKPFLDLTQKDKILLTCFKGRIVKGREEEITEYVDFDVCDTYNTTLAH